MRRLLKTWCQIGEYMCGLPACMLIFGLSVGTQTTQHHKHHMEVGRWVRRCVDPVRDLSQSYWTGQNVATYQTALREGQYVSNGIEEQVIKLYVLIFHYLMIYFLTARRSVLEQNAERLIYQAIVLHVPHVVTLDHEENGVVKVKAILGDVSPSTCLFLLVLLI